jgi:hypothetical protein
LGEAGAAIAAWVPGRVLGRDRPGGLNVALLKERVDVAAVVVRFSRARRRYERQGVLVEEPALEQAEAECLVDEDARLRRRQRERERRAVEDADFERELANEIGRLFPGALLMAGVDRSQARERVRATVGSVLEAWRTPPG